MSKRPPKNTPKIPQAIFQKSLQLYIFNKLSTQSSLNIRVSIYFTKYYLYSFINNIIHFKNFLRNNHHLSYNLTKFYMTYSSLVHLILFFSRARYYIMLHSFLFHICHRCILQHKTIYIDFVPALCLVC